MTKLRRSHRVDVLALYFTLLIYPVFLARLWSLSTETFSYVKIQRISGCVRRKKIRFVSYFVWAQWDFVRRNSCQLFVLSQVIQTKSNRLSCPTFRRFAQSVQENTDILRTCHDHLLRRPVGLITHWLTHHRHLHMVGSPNCRGIRQETSIISVYTDMSVSSQRNTTSDDGGCDNWSRTVANCTWLSYIQLHTYSTHTLDIIAHTL